MGFLMESDAVVRFVITLILFQLLGIEIRACVLCHPVFSTIAAYRSTVEMGRTSESESADIR